MLAVVVPKPHIVVQVEWHPQVLVPAREERERYGQKERKKRGDQTTKKSRRREKRRDEYEHAQKNAVTRGEWRAAKKATTTTTLKVKKTRMTATLEEKKNKANRTLNPNPKRKTVLARREPTNKVLVWYGMNPPKNVICT